MVTVLLLSVVVLYCLELALFRRGLGISSLLPRSPLAEPTVSIIIAARNEADRILDCLKSLRSVDYPREKLEIVVVDDSSTDDTAGIVGRFIDGSDDIRLLKSPPESGNLRGKTNAIAEGIRRTTGEILMFTDADCAVHPGWVRGTVRYFDDETGIVGGFTVLGNGRMFHAVQALDWLYLFSIASATASLGFPLTAIGNNLSVRRKAYEETGGYEVIPFSVTEDYSLVQTILQKTRYRIRFPLAPDTVVTSRACDTIKQLLRQKQRWGVGALDMVPEGMAVITLGWFARLAVVIGAFLLPPTLALTAAAVLVLSDYAFLSRVFGRLSLRRVRRFFLPFEIYLTLYGLIIPVIAFGSRNVVWKERTLRREKKNAFPEERHRH